MHSTKCIRNYQWTFHVLLFLDVRNLCDRLKVVHGEDPVSRHSNQHATKLMTSLVRAGLCAKSVTQEHRLSSEAFDWLLAQIECRFQQAQVGCCAWTWCLSQRPLSICCPPSPPAWLHQGDPCPQCAQSPHSDKNIMLYILQFKQHRPLSD